MSPTPDRRRSLEELYRAALELPADQREAFLKESCSDIERQAIQSLLSGPPNPDSGHSHPEPGKPPGIQPGTKLGPYQVERRIGAGGMGEVYRARDTRLAREVALKLLPPYMANDTERRARFIREARAASRLNHPNAVTVYDIGEHEGRVFIAMEYVEGKTLDAMIPASGLPLADVLRYAVPIAAAVGKAHSAGIIHRDLKPGNVMVATDGSVKVLDFGLAKLVDEPNPPDETSNAAQLETQTGMFLGTPAFMSPEQAEGKPVDRRSDVFSFGALLYQMAAGKRAFTGTSMTAVMAAVLQNEPDPLPGTIDPELRKIVLRCLQKDPDRRFQSIADVRLSLEELCAETAGHGRTKAAEAGVGGTANRAAIPAAPQARFRIRWSLAIAGAVAAGSGIAAFILLQGRHATALTAADTIVLADFENKTGEPVFDGALKQALAVDLGQSPFLNILSDQKVTATLRLMGRRTDEPLTGELARELCQRVGGKALLSGSISALGSTYAIGLNSINCANGDTLAQQQVEAHGKENVLKALGKAAIQTRRRLGESLASVQKFATPIEEATTSSLEALKAYSMGVRAFRREGELAAIAFHQQAIGLDPDFAMPYSAMAVCRFSLGQAIAGREDAKKAFALRERVSEREKYRISGVYYTYVTGELETAAHIYELWRESYPRDAIPDNNLADIRMRLGRYEQALPAEDEAARLDPSSITYSNLAQIQLALNRPDTASTTLDQAAAHRLDSSALRLVRYGLAFFRGDQSMMRQELAAAAGRPGQEDWLLSAQSDTEAYFGRMQQSRALSQRAKDSALRAGAREAAALWQVDAALREAELGNPNAARESAVSALSLAQGREVRCFAALTLARAADDVRAQKLAANLNNDFPQDTLIQHYWLPAIRAASESNRKNYAGALKLLEETAPYESGQNEPLQVGTMYPVYLRGLALLMARRGREAGIEFQKILDHRGIVLNFPTGALARVGLARALAIEGDNSQARTAYREFLMLWKDADAIIPLLQQAKAEYSKLE